MCTFIKLGVWLKMDLAPTEDVILKKKNMPVK